MVLEGVVEAPPQKKNESGGLWSKTKKKARSLFGGSNEKKPEPELAPKPHTVEEKPQENDSALGAPETVETTTTKQPENQTQPAEDVSEDDDKDDFFKVDGYYEIVPEVPHRSSESEISIAELPKLKIINKGESITEDGDIKYIENRNYEKAELKKLSSRLALIKTKIEKFDAKKNKRRNVDMSRYEDYIDMVQNTIDDAGNAHDTFGVGRVLDSLNEDYKNYSLKVEDYQKKVGYDGIRLGTFEYLRDLNKMMYTEVFNFMTA